MSSTRWIRGGWTLAGVAGVACLAGVWIASDAPDARPDTEGERGSAVEPSIPSARMGAKGSAGERTGPSRAVLDEGACGLTRGQRFGATFFSEASLSMSAPAPAASGDRSKAQTVAGELAFEVLDASAATAVVLVAFSPEAPRSTDGPAYGEGLSAPFLARINERCEVAEFARHKDTSTTIARAQQSLLHELWFSVPAHGEQSHVSFENAVGEALGEMRRDERGDLTRTIHLYRETWSKDMGGVEVKRSEMHVERGQMPWFDSIRGDETVVVAASKVTGRSTLKVDAIEIDSSALTDAPRDVGEYVWGSMLAPYDSVIAAAEPAGHAERVAQMKDVTFEQALERFGTLVETKANQEDQPFLMAAFLDAHPEHIKEYSQALATHFPDEWKPPGYVALQLTQDPAAKAALLDLFREKRLRPMERVRSSLALAGRADVGAALARELSVVATSPEATKGRVSVKEHALLHLGVLAGTHAGDEEVAAITRDTVLEMLAAAETPGELKSAFLAVANTGDVGFLPALQEWSQHPDPYMRAEVAIGMRRMPVASTRALTLEWLERETSFDVKREIFEVLQRQYHDARATLDDELVAQAVAHLDERPRALTRQSLYRLLTPAVRDHPDVRRALREALVLETRKKSGMAQYLINILPEHDVSAALATIDTLSDQFAGGAPPEPPDLDVEPEDPEPPPDLTARIQELAIPAHLDDTTVVQP